MPSPSRSGESGFTIIEIIVAAALFALVSIALFEVVRQTQNVTRHLAERHTNYLEIRRFADQLRSEAVSAQAIAVSPGCTEIQFFMQDAGGSHYWGYRLNGNEIDRYAAAGPLPACTADPNDSPVLHAVTSLTATNYSVADLASRGDSPFITTSAATLSQLDAKVDLHYRDASGAPIIGGNHVIEVIVENDIASYTVDLSPGVRPSGYDKVLLYTCGARGGCGSAIPPTSLLAGADISKCSRSSDASGADVDPVATRPASLDTDVPCPDGQGLCTYVATWNVVGSENINYFGNNTSSRALPDAWNIASFPSNPAHTAADLVKFPTSDSNAPQFPAFSHQIDAATAAGSLASETGAGTIQTDRAACDAVNNEPYYQNI